MSKKLFVLFLIPFALLFSLSALAQDDDDEIDREIPNNVRETDGRWKWERAFVGGNLGAWFGNTTFIDLSPSFGYFVHERVAVAAGPIYQYYRVSDKTTGYAYKTHIYGGRTFTRGYILEQLFAHAEFEFINLDAFNQITGEYLGRRNVSSLPLGIGYAQRSGGSAFNLMLLYDVLQNKYSPYGNRVIIRMGFGIGL